MKILLFFLLSAISQLLSLGCAVYVPSSSKEHNPLCCSLRLRRGLSAKIGSAAPTSSGVSTLKF